MDALFPLFIGCVVPMVWTAGAFLLGRWSASHTIRIERREEVPIERPYQHQPQYEGEI